MTIRAFIFDLDGVIINSKESHRYAYVEMASQYGLKLDKEKLEHRLRTAPGKGTLAFLYPDISADTRDHLLKTQKAILASPVSVSKTTLVRDALEAAYSLHNRGLPIAIVTNSTEAFVNEVFHRLSIPEIFDYVLPKKEDSGAKEERFRYVLGRWNLPPQDVLYVGDAASDVEVGRKIGTRVAIIFNKYSWSWPVKTQIVEAQPDYILENTKQILELV